MIKLLDLLKEAKGQKKAIIMAGGAGAGKSTFSKQLQSDLKKAGWTDLNADKYVEDPDSTMYNNLGAAASRIDKVDLPNTLEKGQNFLYDTTASNVQRVQGIKDQGYDIMMVMVYTNPIVSFLRNFLL
jgi:predicted ABC-type ATPase